MSITEFGDLSAFISLSAAGRLLPNNPAPSTIWRWHRHGIRNIRLKTWIVGRRRYTTVSAVREFVAATTAAANAAELPESVPERSAYVTQQLEEEGILPSMESARGERAVE